MCSRTLRHLFDRKQCVAKDNEYAGQRGIKYRNYDGSSHMLDINLIVVCDSPVQVSSQSITTTAYISLSSGRCLLYET